MADGSLQLIDGHLRTETVGPDVEIPVLVLDVSAEEASKILATFDPLGAMAETDAETLGRLMSEVSFDSPEVNEMLAALLEGDGEGELQGGNTDPDAVPEAPVDPVTKPGNVWLLGDHRLMCGSSADEASVRRLMDGNRVQCVFTDPPYGVSISAKNEMLNTFQKAGRCLTSIEDDDLKPDDLKAKLVPAFTNLRTLIMAEDCTLFVSAPQGGELCMMMMMMIEAGLKARHVLIWKKNSPTFSMGRLDYDYQHEPILLTWGKRHKRPMAGTHKTSVWEVDKPRSSVDHPTMKPVELYVNAYLNNSDPGDSVADIYSGSGTAFIASEQTGRRCFGMEISPVYCDVIVKRWEEFTGKKAVLETRKE